MVSSAGIDTSSFTDHPTRAVSASKAKSLSVSTKEVLKKRQWLRVSTCQKHHCKEKVELGVN